MLSDETLPLHSHGGYRVHPHLQARIHHRPTATLPQERRDPHVGGGQGFRERKRTCEPSQPHDVESGDAGSPCFRYGTRTSDKRGASSASTHGDFPDDSIRIEEEQQQQWHLRDGFERAHERDDDERLGRVRTAISDEESPSSQCRLAGFSCVAVPDASEPAASNDGH